MTTAVQSIADEGGGENIRFVYGQLCDSYRAIDDFRGKLLTLLPIGTGVFLVLPDLAKSGGDAAKARVVENFLQTLSPAVGLFGMAVAIGLFVLELYGIRKCTHLIETGKLLEHRLNVTGQFRQRAPGFFKFISEPFAAGVIYPAVIAAWAYIGLYTVPMMCGPVWACAIFAVFFLGSMAFIRWLHADARKLSA